MLVGILNLGRKTMTENDAETIKIINMIYPVAKKEELINRQLIGGTQIQKFLYGLNIDITLLAYDYIEIVCFWSWFIPLMTCYIVIMSSFNFNMLFNFTDIDPVTGGERDYGLKGAVWLRHMGFRLLTRLFRWYPLIIKKI